MAYKYRKFNDEFHHDETIIKNWNSVVNKKDLVYILGDITMETNKWYFRLDELNGRKIVVLGNHDDPKHVPELLTYVEKVAGMIKYKHHWLTHAPIHPSELRGYKNIHGHCISKESEILTTNGWKSAYGISKDDLVYSEDEYGILHEKPIDSLIMNNYSGKIFKSIQASVNFDVTDKHRMFGYDKNNNREILYADEYFSRNNRKVKLSSNINKKDIQINDDLIRLYILLAADGSINKKTNLGRLKVIKNYKIKYMQNVLNFLNIEYSKNKQKDGSICFNFKIPKEFKSLNIKGLDNWILDFSERQCNIVLEAYQMSDGCKNGKGTIIYTSKLKEVDLLQHLFVINGFSAAKHTRYNHGFSKNASHQLSVYKRGVIQLTKSRSNTIESIVNDELYWCITTEYGNFLTRLNGKVHLTGNCHGNTIMDGNRVDERYINACLDVHDYTPVLFSELIKEK